MIVEQKPIYPDPRNWWEKLIGERWTPVYRLDMQSASELIHTATQQNRRHAARWHGKIGRIRIK